MNYQLPTFEECLLICEQPDTVFYKKEDVIPGYKVVMFGYKHSIPALHKMPVADNPNLTANELRGISFVFNLDGSLYKRNLMLHKFYNYNQVEETMHDSLSSLTIEEVYPKLDGSLVTFIDLPNGEVISKTQTNLFLDTKSEIPLLYHTNIKIQKFTQWCFKNNYSPMFECTTPNKRIVLRYDKPELTLLRVRDNLTGEYLDLDSLDYDLSGLLVVQKVKNLTTLSALVEVIYNTDNAEGWIVKFTNGLFVKFKTKWYFENHRNMLSLESLVRREDVLIGTILNGEADDLLSSLALDRVEMRNHVIKMTELINNYITKKAKEINDAYQMYVDLGCDMRAYSLAYGKDELFLFVANLVGAIKRGQDRDAYSFAKEYIAKNTNLQKKARLFLEKIKLELKED